MAVNLNQNNPNVQQNQPGQQPGSNAIQPQSQFKPRTSGFTNLQRVLGANKDNKLGSAIKTGVQNIANKTTEQTQKAQNDFTSQIGQSVDDIKKGQSINQNLQGIDFAKDSNAAQQKVQQIGNQSDVTARFRQGYQGPQELKNAEQLQNQAEQLQQTGQNLMSQGGRQAALQRFVNAGPNYTQGKQRLDNLLLGQDPNSLREARRSAAQTATQTGEAITNAAQQGQYTGQEYNRLGQNIQSGLSSAGQNLSSSLNQRASQQQKNALDQVNQLKDRVRSGSLEQADYENLVNNVLGGSENTYNLSPDQINALYDANQDFNISNVAQQGEVSARDALAKLSGLESGDKLIDLDEAKAGTAKEGLLLNQQNISALQQQRQAAENAMKNFAFDPSGSASQGYSLANPYAVNNPHGTPANLTYDQVKSLYPQLSQLSQSHTGANYNQLLEAGAAAGLLRNDDMTRIRQNLGDQYDLLYNTNFAPLVDQYENTNKQYGIGNSLASLLAANKTFGKIT